MQSNYTEKLQHQRKGLQGEKENALQLSWHEAVMNQVLVEGQLPTVNMEKISQWGNSSHVF